MHHLPQFSNLDLTVYPTQLEHLLQSQRTHINQLLQSATHWNWQNLIAPLEELDNALECFWSPLSHLHAVLDSTRLRDCFDACLPLLSAHESELSQHTNLYNAIASLEQTTLNPAQRKIIHDKLRDFKLAGVNLNTTEKQRLQAIDARLSELANQFEHNLLDAEAAFSLSITDPARLTGLPTHIIDEAQRAATNNQEPGWLLQLSYPTYLAIMTYAKDRALRETFYQAYATRASDRGPHAGQFDNTPVLTEILTLRHERALLLGFAHYADYSLATKMAASSTQVLGFLSDLLHRAKPQAQHEFESLRQFAQTHCQLDSLSPWDIAYVAQLKKQHEHQIDDEQIRAYFPLARVMQGVQSLLQTLFAIELREMTEPCDTWHAEVRCYALLNRQQQLMGYLYCDLFARANKRSGAWMDSLQSRRQLADGRVQLPIATLTCNFANTAPTGTATLSHDEVITLLHEMGHCLHHLLTEVDYFHASGLHGVEWDAVELPSQLLENWAWTAEGLSLLSAHVSNGETLPAPLLSALLTSKQFQAAMSLMRQLELALFDFEVHLLDPNSTNDPNQAMTDVLARVQQRTRVVPTYPNNRLPQSFSHIFAGGYAAGYYSYLWAEVLSSDAFARFETEGILNATVGQALLQEILAVGSTRPAAESYRQFRGRDATLDAFLQQHGIANEASQT